jgi:hypothetical protein
MKKLVAVALATGLMASRAEAQIYRFSNDPNTLRISANFQIMYPSPPASDSSDQVTKAMGASSTALFAIVSHECDVLQNALNGACKLVQLNISSGVNRQYLGAGALTGSAQATFEIEKPIIDRSRRRHDLSAGARAGVAFSC